MDLISTITDLASNTPTLFLIGIASCATIAYLFLRDSGSFPPGPISWPIIGNLITVARAGDKYKLLKDLQKKYGDVFRLRIGQETFIFVFGHKYLTKLLVKDGDDTADRPDWMFVPKNIVKQRGIIWSSGDKWLKLNNLITQAQMDKHVHQNFLQELQQEIEELGRRFSGYTATDPLDHFYSTTLNIVAILVFGKRYTYNDDELREIRDTVDYVISQSARKETAFSWLAYFTKSEVQEIVSKHEEFYSFLKQKLDDHKTNFDPAKPRDLLDIYIGRCQSGSKDESVSETDMFQSVLNLFVAAKEVYTASLMFAVFFLVKYPKVQAKCRAEILENLDDKEIITEMDRQKLPYFDATLKEILRIASPVVLSLLRTNRRSLTVGKYTIPEQSILIFDLSDPKMDPKLWDNPEVFDPDRWETTKGPGFSPYGMGPRRCVGEITSDASLFLILANMLQKYEVHAEKREDLVMEKEWRGVCLFPNPFKVYMKPVRDFAR